MVLIIVVSSIVHCLSPFCKLGVRFLLLDSSFAVIPSHFDSILQFFEISYALRVLGFGDVGGRLQGQTSGGRLQPKYSTT